MSFSSVNGGNSRRPPPAHTKATARQSHAACCPSCCGGTDEDDPVCTGTDTGGGPPLDLSAFPLLFPRSEKTKADASLTYRRLGASAVATRALPFEAGVPTTAAENETVVAKRVLETNDGNVSYCCRRALQHSTDCRVV